MIEPLEICLHRWEFVQRFSKGVVLDVGCKEGDSWLHPTFMLSDVVTNPPSIRDIILCDCDVWHIRSILHSQHKFIRCFAEDIPLTDKSVDTVVLAEIIEHVKDPNKLIQEAKRLARDRIVITTGNEYKWPKDIHRSFVPTGDATNKSVRDYLISQGIEYHRKYQLDNAFLHPTHECTMVVDDTEFSHCDHENDYDDNSFQQLIKDNSDGMEYHIFNLKFARENFVHLAAVMYWRK